MSKSFDSLDKTFDIVPAEKSTEIVNHLDVPQKPQVKDTTEDRGKDYTYARSQLYNIVEKMQESLSDAVEVAQQSEHPRAYEVVFNGAKNAAEVVEKLADLHKKMDDLEKDKPQTQSGPQVQNNMFVGSTAELMKMLKENK